MKTPCIIDGINFESMTSACEYFGVCKKTIKKFIKNNKSREVKRYQYKPFYIDELKFKSKKEAAEFFGVSLGAIDYYKKIGHRPKMRKPQPVKINGISYSSMTEAANKLNVQKMKITIMAKRGELELL